MIDGTAFNVLREAGPWVSFGLLIAFGWLIPRKTHSDRIKDYQQRVSYLESAIEHERKINNFQNEQLSKLLILAETGNKVLDALQRSSNKEAA